MYALYHEWASKSCNHIDLGYILWILLVKIYMIFMFHIILLRFILLSFICVLVLYFGVLVFWVKVVRKHRKSILQFCKEYAFVWNLSCNLCNPIYPGIKSTDWHYHHFYTRMRSSWYMHCFCRWVLFVCINLRYIA